MLTVPLCVDPALVFSELMGKIFCNGYNPEI